MENQSHFHGEKGGWDRTKNLAWAGTEFGAARVLDGGGLEGVGPLLALKPLGKQTALHFSCLVVKNIQTRQPVLCTPAEEAARQPLALSIYR